MITKSSVAHASLVMSLGRNNASQRTLARPTKLEDHLGTEYLLAFSVTAIFQVVVLLRCFFFLRRWNIFIFTCEHHGFGENGQKEKLGSLGPGEPSKLLSMAGQPTSSDHVPPQK